MDVSPEPGEALAPATPARAPVMEVFASVQGEGRYAGEPQVFLRLRGCPMRCRYCDTPGSWRVAPSDRARIVAADGGARREDPWATPFRASVWIREAEGRLRRTLSVTGGEPLAWPGFVAGLRALLGDRRIHLETAGAHPRALERVLGGVDHVSLDLKLADDLGAPVELAESEEGERAPADRSDWRRARRRALELVRDRDACGKLVLCGGVEPSRFEPILVDVAELAPALPLYVQPATPVAGAEAPAAEAVEELAERVLWRGLGVRVVPQIHRALGLP